MDDLISRQDAIDALDQIFDRCEEIEAHLPEGDPDRTGYRMYPDYMTVWKYLRQLSSAQPEIVRCQYCKYRIENKHYGERGYMKLKAMCELDTGDPFGLGRNAEDDEWFCADGERREDDVDPSNR